MSKKRTSDESNYDDGTNEGPETPVQREGNAKREKLDLLSNTTLQDLPFELLECILIKAVFTEVKDLIRVVWKRKADQVILRLQAVCWQWSNVLATNSFRTKLHRILDDTAQTIRLELLHESPVSPTFHAITTLKDDIFLLRSHNIRGYTICVYDRNDMQTVKDVIAIPKAYDIRMTGCNASNSVYVRVQDVYGGPLSVSLITRESGVGGMYKMSSWECNHSRSIALMGISANGGLMILSKNDPYTVSIYNVDDTLEREIPLAIGGPLCAHEGLFRKPNGNLVVYYFTYTSFEGAKLLEVDMSGNVERQYVSSCMYRHMTTVSFADSSGRIMIADTYVGVELLDSEFNLLGIFRLPQNVPNTHLSFDLHYDSERDEVACVCTLSRARASVLSIFRFTG